MEKIIFSLLLNLQYMFLSIVEKICFFLNVMVQHILWAFYLIFLNKVI